MSTASSRFIREAILRLCSALAIDETSRDASILASVALSTDEIRLNIG